MDGTEDASEILMNRVIPYAEVMSLLSNRGQKDVTNDLSIQEGLKG
jgi:hypothetical protein